MIAIVQLTLTDLGLAALLVLANAAVDLILRLGLGRRLLVELGEHARSFGYAGIVLETGDRQPESVGLYSSAGFERIPCYPPYSERALSLCFEKQL